jgi:flagellar protein FlaF
MAQGYAAAQRATLGGRDLEREVFSRITARLQAADTDRAGGLAALASALEENRRLWCALALDLSSPNNRLPDALKAGLISLAAFVEKQSPRVLAREASRDVLVDINRNVVLGLTPPHAEAA